MLRQESMQSSFAIIAAVFVSLAMIRPASAQPQVWTLSEPLNKNAATDSGHDSQPQLTTDGAGNWLAVWHSFDDLGGTIDTDGDILMSRSSDNGATWTSPEPVNNNAFSDSGYDRFPQVTSDEAGIWVIVWFSDEDLDPPGPTIGSDDDILFAYSTDIGATWTNPMPLNTNATSDDNCGDQNPQVTSDGVGNWVAVWGSFDSVQGVHTRDILWSRISNADLLAGNNWSEAQQLNNTGEGGHNGVPQLTTDGAGNWVALWQSRDGLGGVIENDSDILWARNTTAGLLASGTWTDPEPVNTNAPTDTAIFDYHNPRLTTDGFGNWVAMWECNITCLDNLGPDPDLLWARTTTADLLAGNDWTDQVPLNNDAATDVGSDHEASVTTDGSGNWIVVWQYGAPTIRWASITTADLVAGELWTDPEPLHSSPCWTPTGSHTPELATDDAGNWVVVWGSDDSLFGAIGGDFDILVARACTLGDSLCPDCNDTGVLDDCELFAGTINDCNENGVADECDIEDRTSDDCNANNIPDECEIDRAAGPGFYCDSTDPPPPLTECDPDCNDNGIPDECDIAPWPPIFTGPELLNNNAATDLGSDLHPQVTTNGAGNWVAVWTSDDELGGTIGTDSDVLVALSSNNGLTWTDPAPLNNNAATDSGEDQVPQVTTDGFGNWVAVWWSEDSLGGTIGTDSDIMVALSSDNGLTWTDPEPLNNNAGADTGIDLEPELATDGSGNWVAIWLSSEDLGGNIGTDRDILVALSSDNGLTWTDPEPLNNNASTDSDDDTSPKIATDGIGSWVVAWFSEDTLSGTIGSDEDILVARSSANGATWTDPEPLNNNAATDIGQDRDVRITTDGNGNWIAAWHSSDSLGGIIGTDNDTLVAHSSDNGLTWTDPEPLNNNAAIDSGSDASPKVVTDGAGNWVAAWASTNDLLGTVGTDRDIFVALSSDNGQTWTDPVPLNNNAATDSGGDHAWVGMTTDGIGQWVAAWLTRDTLGGTIGTDFDILVARFAFSQDCNENGVPDDCDLIDDDCNENSVPDECDLAEGRSTDCNANLLPDECEIDEGSIAPGGPYYCDPADPPPTLSECDLDCNNNGNPDECDISWPPVFTGPEPLNKNADTDTGIDNDPQLATDGAGNWVAVWYSDDSLGIGLGPDNDILVALSMDDAHTWTHPAPLNNNAAIDTGLDQSPNVTTDGVGNWVATWSSTEDLPGQVPPIGPDVDILVARITTTELLAGDPWTDPVPLNSNAGTDSEEDQSPLVITDRAGNWVAVWMSRNTSGGTDQDIMFARITTADLLVGDTWTAPAPLNSEATTDSGDDGSAQLSTDRIGNWVAVWEFQDVAGGPLGTDMDILVARSTDNGATWTDPEPLNNNAAEDAGRDQSPQVTTDGVGNWLAVWHSNEDLASPGPNTSDFDILVARSTDNGDNWTDPMPLNNDAATDAERDLAPYVTTDEADNWVTVWDCQGCFGVNEQDILVAYSNDGGSIWTDPKPLNNNAATDVGNDDTPWLTTDGAGNWVAVWKSQEDLDPPGPNIGIDFDVLVARFSVPVSRDCNGNAVPDECEINLNSPAPGGPYFCDPVSPPSPLAECDPDCNDNGTPDECDTPICGDGCIMGVEECDDGNSDDGDGCSSICTIEPGCVCSGKPSVCVCKPVEPPPPNNRKKNRYISFQPSNAGMSVKLKVTLTDSLPHPGLIGSLWWVQDPVVPVAGQFPKPLLAGGECVALLGPESSAAEIDWDAAGCQVLHVTGCPIEPTSENDVQAVAGASESDPLTIATALQPGGGKWWGDTVGIFNGTEWTAAQGVTNIDDVVVAIKTWQGGQVVPPGPIPPGNMAHLSIPDVEPGNINTVVNFADVQRLIQAFQAEMYPFGPADADGNCP